MAPGTGPVMRGQHTCPSFRAASNIAAGTWHLRAYYSLQALRLSLPGCITALATPFSGAGTLDQDAWRGLLNLQLRGGVQGVVVAGSTGEAAALSDDQDRVLTCEAVQLVEGAMPVVAGTGPMNTGTIAQTRSGPPPAGGVAPAVRLAPQGDPAAASAWDAQLAEFHA